MSSPYPVLYNRPIDQWKVTELKEELRKRKLMTKGLKEDLVKRLDEAIRNERESVNEELDNGFALDSDSEVKSEDSKSKPIGSQVVEEAPGYVVNEGEKVDNVDVAAATVDSGGNNANAETAQEDQVQDDKSMNGTDKNSKVDETAIHTVSMENSVIDGQSVETKLESSAQVTKCNIQVENEDSKPPSFEDVKSNISDPNNQN
ncbi:hypothetical protein MRB53_034297 [Persea americana]|uniref:Uncharacterized protein n=1 Tax=Persea americana TaxID=3435 RepID=A0ACC2KX12_PERAE|nr:hypothetical protein MRB53_034297 [Persea americana]